MMFHVCAILPHKGDIGPIQDFGPFGVDLFFVLSGVIIARIAPGQGAGPFIWRRLTRILPLYWVLTLLWMAALARLGRLDLAGVSRSLLLYPSAIDPYLNVAWTLRFELLFYFAAGLVLKWPRAAPVALALGYAAAFVARTAHSGVMLDFFGAPVILEFVAGLVIARLPGSRIGLALAGLGALAGLVVIGVTGFHGDPASREIYYGLPAAMIVYAATQVKARGWLADRLAYLGDASYAAYLVHLIPIYVLASFFGLAPVSIVGAMVVCWLIAILVHEGLERPLLAFCRRPFGRAFGVAVRSLP